jgi:hypothetical protein
MNKLIRLDPSPIASPKATALAAATALGILLLAFANLAHP